MRPVEERHLRRCRDEEPMLHVDEIVWGIGEGAKTLTEQVFGTSRREQAPPPLRLVPPREREPGDDDEEV